MTKAWAQRRAARMSAALRILLDLLWQKIRIWKDNFSQMAAAWRDFSSSIVRLVLVPVEPASTYWQQEYCTLAARILLAGSKTFARWQQDKFLTGINADHTSRTECKWSRNPKWGFVILKCMNVSTFPSWDVLVLHANVYNLDILDFI